MNDSGLSYPSIAGLAIAAMPAWTAALIGEVSFLSRILMLMIGVMLSWLALKFIRIPEIRGGGRVIFTVATFFSLLAFIFIERNKLDIDSSALFAVCIFFPLLCVEVYLYVSRGP